MNYDIINNRKFDERLKNSLEIRHKERETWAKCFVKTNSTRGAITTSRIESKYRFYKRYLNDTTRLAQLLMIFKELEEEEIKKKLEKLKSVLKKNPN